MPRSVGVVGGSTSFSRLIRQMQQCCLPVLSFVVDYWRRRGQIGTKGGKLWVIADHLVNLVIARSLSSCGGRGGLRTRRRDGRKFRRHTDDVLDGDDHGKNAIDVAVVVILVNNRKRAKQSKGRASDIVVVVFVLMGERDS